jgi:3-oxochol-4-en-24-oyl-CoA dehydrogenase
MSIALSDDHCALADVARSFLSGRSALGAAREALDATSEQLPAFWKEIADLGWIGLHLPERFGGQGYGLAELAVVTEELGRVVAPGPFLPTVLAAAVIDRCGHDAQRARFLPGIADGSTIAAVGLTGGLTLSAGRLDGDAGGVLGGGLAGLLLLAVGDDLVVVDADASGLRITPTDALDPTCRVVDVSASGVVVGADQVLPGGLAVALTVGRSLAAASAAGGARACLEMATEYAKVREQFGRTIGSFQAIKHHCAEMLVDAELAAAVAWEAARTDGTGDQASFAAAVAATQALPSYRRNAEKNIQIHGGIGYTWEHDAHLHLRRASSLAATFGADLDAPLDVTRLSAGGVGIDPAVDLPPGAEEFRTQAREFRAEHDALPPDQRRAALIDSGYLMPHWPRPWGRGAGVVEQLVIDEELAGVEQPNLGIGTWVLLTLVQHGTPDQLERWIRPSLLGELKWCQLFSEPNAGSDAAAIQTRATRVDGGWTVNGQKVWTSAAHECNRGLATVRTDPSAPKHAGVSTFAIDMHAPGVEIRPLRELTGETLFNEVFFDDVFVADDDVVGIIDRGWTVARATLGNERVSIGGNKGGLDLVRAGELATLVAERAGGDVGLSREVGSLIAEEHAMASLNLRQVSRAIAGGPPGAEGNVSKLLSAEHAQRVGALGLRISAMAGVSGGVPRVSHTYLFSRCLTIAGGTSEIVRNLIAERLLGLPREKM